MKRRGVLHGLSVFLKGVNRMRLIDADALIPNEECDKKRCIDCEWNYVVGCEDVENLVKLAQTIEPEQRWIPCSERLPEYGQNVLVCYEDGSMGVNKVIDEYDEEWFIYWVVAWMPLPEPWKGEQDG